jgi:hypothetical protein
VVCASRVLAANFGNVREIKEIVFQPESAVFLHAALSSVGVAVLVRPDV